MSIQHLKSGGTYPIIAHQDSKQTLVMSDLKGNCVLHITGHGTLDLNIEVADHCEWDILILHTGNDDLEIQESITLGAGADVTVSYGQFTGGKVSKTSEYHLQGKGASLHTLGAVLSSAYLNWTLQSNHLALDTYASLSTNVVVGDHGDCRLEVIGSIPKGNRGSKTHQMTKILNLGKDSVAMVYPKLLIDENDVEASHAASVGQPEEEHVFYLMSRGLSYSMAMQLLIKGYLHPVVDRIEDEELKATLLDIIELEVASYV